MSIGVKLDKPVTQLGQVRFEEQLKERGIVDKNDNGFITSNEIDTDRVRGGLNEVKRAAGTDGLLQPSEVGGVNIKRGTIETVKDTLGLTKEKAATEGVQEATKQIRKVVDALYKFSYMQEGVSLYGVIRSLRDIDSKGQRADIGLADESTVKEMEGALKELAKGIENFGSMELWTQPAVVEKVSARQITSYVIRSLRPNIDTLHKVATETFGITFPDIDLRMIALKIEQT